MNVMSLDQQENGAPLNKGIKSPSKLCSPKYQAQSSLRERNRNSSSPKRVYFVNTVTIKRKEDEPKETGIIEPTATKSNDHKTIVEIEKKVEGELSGPETVIEGGESNDIGHNDPEDRAYKDEKGVEEEGEWMEYDQPI
ncbi:hypothetical protein Tco_1499156 [Tanacetum coccineum]